MGTDVGEGPQTVVAVNRDEGGEAASQLGGGAPGVPGLPVPGLPDPALEEDAAEESLIPEELDGLEQLDGLAKPAEAEESSIRPGSRCTGTVIAIGRSGVIVAFGAKVEGRVPEEEFLEDDGSISVEPGQQVEVVVERLGAPGKFAVLSHRKVRERDAWKRVEASHAGNLPLKGKVLGRVKGGLRVDVGVRAFLPGSQVELRPTHQLDPWIGQTVEVVVLECNRRRSNVVVSRRALLNAKRLELQRETLSKIEVGGTATGVVKTVTKYGVFVDLGGIDGRIKLADLSHGRVGNPADLFQPGQELTAKVLRIDRERERVALSLRAMHPDPWLTVEDRYPPGSRVQGRVVTVTDYGAFVELESGVEGLIHISEISWSRHPKHPSETFSPGTETEAVVLKLSPSERRISLSFKRLLPDPWDQLADSLEVGRVVAGVVRRIKDYGLFVEIAEGVEGLVHVSDLSWDQHARNARGFASRGDQIDTVILHVDSANRRLSLGVKQLEPDVWDTFLAQYAVGDTVPGLVRRIVQFGAFVELIPGVEGLCHVSQSPRGDRALQEGLRYHFLILDVNERARRIGLRCYDGLPIPGEEENQAAG